MKTLILLTAVPGAGKSTWAKRYQSEHLHTYIISSDDLRMELLGGYQNFSNEDLVWSTFRNRIHEYAKLHDDVTVILDAVNYSNKGRLYYKDESPEFDEHILVYVKKPLDVILRQNRDRDLGKIVPEDVVKNYFMKIEEPSEAVLAAYRLVVITD